MKQIVIIFCLVAVAAVKSILAQDVRMDSLEMRLQNVEEIDKIPILIELIELNQQDHPRQALEYAASAERLIAAYPDPVRESLLKVRLGWANYYLNDFEAAMDLARQAEAMALVIPHAENIVRAKMLKGRVFRQYDDYEPALAAMDSALVLMQNIDNPLLRASILNEAGSIYRRKGESGRALELHLRALDLVEGSGDKPLIATTYNFLGIMHDIIGIYDEALRYQLQSLQIREELGDRRGMAASMTNIGTVHQRIGQYPEALHFYQQTLPIWKELEAEDPLASTYNNIGTVYELMGQYEQARSYYEDANEIWSRLGNLYSTTISLDNLGAIHMYLGDFHQALSVKKETLKNHMQLGNSRGSSNTLNSIAMIHLKLMQPDSALVAAQQSLELALESESWSLIRNAHEVLSDVYETSGDYGKALEHHKLYKAAHDTLFNSDSQTVIAELQEQYRTRQQQQQIDRLQQERELQRLWMIILIGGIVLVLVITGILYNRYNLKVRTSNQLYRAELEKARLHAENVEANTKLLQAENERKSRELEAARNMQLSMLPAVLPESKHAFIAAYMATATEVGGDYYDIDMDEDGTLTFCIGDATGHGTKAGLLVTAMKSLFNLMSRDKDLEVIIQRCSAAIKKLNLSGLYMAFGLARLKKNRLELIGAGMPPALLYRAETGRVERIHLKGMPLGSVLDYPYVKKSVNLHEDDVLLLMSDGYPELTDPDGGMMGYEKPGALLAETGGLSAEAIIQKFTTTAREWTRSNRPNDDMTFVVLKKKPLEASVSKGKISRQQALV